jgi:integrase
VRIVSVLCPFARRRVWELWDGVVPVVAANGYLRGAVLRRPKTVRGKAARLKPFFTFLAANDLSFWDESVRLGGSGMALFKNALVARCTFPSGADVMADDRTSAQVPRDRITARHARQVLREVHQLCLWWRQSNEAPLGAGLDLVDSRGAMPHRMRSVIRLPDVFDVPIPAAERNQQPDVMLPEEVQEVWQHFVDSQPRPSADVARNPLRPPGGWPITRQKRWARDRDRFAVRLAWHRRQQMLWALMLAGGFRRAEVPLLMLRDVSLYRGELWVSLRVRPEHAHLGEAKTGPRLVFIGFDRRVVAAWDRWRESRSVLVSRWMASHGQPDHGMFLVNDDGAPLTVKGLQSLFATLNRRFGTFGDEGHPDDGFRLHPHALRHTIAALLDDAGVPPDVKQRHLGHRSADTTRRYGKTYRATYVEGLKVMEARTLSASAGTSQ